MTLGCDALTLNQWRPVWCWHTLGKGELVCETGEGIKERPKVARCRLIVGSNGLGVLGWLGAGRVSPLQTPNQPPMLPKKVGIALGQQETPSQAFPVSGARSQ